MKYKIKAVIFDLDGVLLDAREWHFEALNKALDIFGIEITLNEHLEFYDGLPTRVKLKKLSEIKGLPYNLHDLINNLKQRFTSDLIHTKCSPYFAHEFLMSKLKQNNIKMAVASNSVSKTVTLAMNYTNLGKFMEFCLSNEDVKKPKPDPEIYNTAINKLGFNPKEVLIIEDNFNGIKAAKASGGHLLEVGSIEEVTLNNVISRIKEIENSL